VGTNAQGGPLNDGGISLGDTTADYSPTSGNWTTAGTTLLLSALNYTTIGFHDAGNRVDFIRAGAGKIQLGYNGGWGEPDIGMPGTGIWNSSGNVGIGTASVSNKLDVIGGSIAIGSADFTANASLHINAVYGGNGRLTQMSTGSGGALNIMTGNGGTNWWSMGVDSSANWNISAGTSLVQLD